MSNIKPTKYYLVDAEMLPEVFLKVMEAKELLQTGEADTVAEAVAMAGISRSAFYKYRDAITPFRNMLSGRILSFQLLLRDERGLLSSILSIFAQFGANILTIHQTVPTGGSASVSISAETGQLHGSVEMLLQELRQLSGVLDAHILAG